MGVGPGAKFHISDMNNPKHRIRATIKTDLRLAQNRKRGGNSLRVPTSVESSDVCVQCRNLTKGWVCEYENGKG